ncbi:MAG TPA: Gfo/Idh/MocA family oxidoreductase [Bacteroidales bacterium]|nr:Gfo/Idh/MocA family oxidoreductase [Bacteroidales bacterium]HRT89393.1 Gfo/Idh/MocA family oxidoreductase [Bacteroidales bacterium]
MENTPKNFGLIGVAGYIAVRHLRAIKDTGNRLLASLDKFDSVGILDSYFPESDFFVEFERFDRHFEKLKRSGTMIDYVSICSPNYLHDSHIRFALRHKAHAICEKPVVLNPWNIDALQEIEKETGKEVYTILQVRLHPKIQELRKKVIENSEGKKHDIDLTYITSRGNWYFFSWKGDVHKSGGVATNIGVHFFDMLSWIFGKEQNNIVHLSMPDKAAGFIELENARIRWFLSLDANDLPDETKSQGKRTYRSITVDGREIEFSEGFTDLHTVSYTEILKGNGFRLEECRQSVETVYNIRNQQPVAPKGEYHPMIRKILK